jgi:hypothetical protein
MNVISTAASRKYTCREYMTISSSCDITAEELRITAEFRCKNTETASSIITKSNFVHMMRHMLSRQTTTRGSTMSPFTAAYETNPKGAYSATAFAASAMLYVTAKILLAGGARRRSSAIDSVLPIPMAARTATIGLIGSGRIAGSSYVSSQRLGACREARFSLSNSNTDALGTVPGSSTIVPAVTACFVQPGCVHVTVARVRSAFRPMRT